MSFLFPAFLIGSLAVAIPIVLHLMKHDVTPRVPFSDIRFLRRAPVATARRRRLRELLLLACRVGAVFCLAVAFARPFLTGSEIARGATTIIALDRSFSMGAPGLFAAAQQTAEQLVADAPGSHEVGLVAFDDGAEVIHAPSADRDAVGAAIRRLTVGTRSTRFGAGVSMAAGLVDARGGAVVVVTDLQAAGFVGPPAAMVPDGISLDVRSVGTEADNLAVGALRARESAVDVLLLNFGAERQTVVTLELDGRSLASEAIMLARGAHERSFAVDVPASGVLEVWLDDPGGFPADDRRSLVLGVSPGPRVVLLHNPLDEGGTFFLERALLAGEGERPLSVETVPIPELPTVDLDQIDAVVLTGTGGLERRGRRGLGAFVSAGGGLLVVGGPEVDPALLVGVTGDSGSGLTLVRDQPRAPTSLAVIDPRHPLFLPLAGRLGALSQVSIRAALGIVETEGAHVLARLTDGRPALVELPTGAGRVLVLATDLSGAWNDLPRHPMFVPLVHEMLAYVIGGGRRLEAAGLGLGDGSTEAATTAGLPRLADGRGRTVDNGATRESDPSRLTRDAVLSRLTVTPATGPAAEPLEPDPAALEADQSYWRWALAAMVMLLVGEAWLGRRLAGR